jgi:hypothetical protein
MPIVLAAFGVVIRTGTTDGSASDDAVAGRSDTPRPAPTRPRAVPTSSPSNAIRGAKPASRHMTSVIARSP